MSYKHEHINGSYTENGKEYPYSLEVIIRDDTGRNDTFEVEWEEATPENAEVVEEKLVDEYFESLRTGSSDKANLDKMIDALYSALTCTWDDNGNIMADAVRDSTLNVLVEVTGKTVDEIENIVDEKVIDSQ